MATGRPKLIFETAETLQASFGFSPARWLDYQALVGDACDSIKGAQGIGDKTARELITANQTLEDIDPATLTKKQAEHWPEFIRRLPVTRRLLTLKTRLDMPPELPI